MHKYRVALKTSRTVRNYNGAVHTITVHDKKFLSRICRTMCTLTYLYISVTLQITPLNAIY